MNTCKAYVRAAALALALATALGRSVSLPAQRQLHEVVNKTVCPFVVHQEVVEGRVPRLIKHIRCAGEGDVQDSLRHYLAEPAAAGLRCVQLVDKVEVQKGGCSWLHPVDVGCACMEAESTEVFSDPGPA